MSGKADEADFTLFAGLEGAFQGAIFAEDEVGIVVPFDPVELPQVDAVGAEPAQAVL